MPVAKAIFDEYMPTPNQIDKKYEDYHISEADLLEVPKGEITEKRRTKNINVGILYIESWLMGTGAAALLQSDGRRCNCRNFLELRFGNGSKIKQN